MEVPYILIVEGRGMNLRQNFPFVAPLYSLLGGFELPCTTIVQLGHVDRHRVLVCFSFPLPRANKVLVLAIASPPGFVVTFKHGADEVFAGGA